MATRDEGGQDRVASGGSVPAFSGTTHLVAGATSGIGWSVAQRLAAAGSGVILLARDGQRLEEALGGLPARPGVTHRALACDVCDAGGLDAAMRRLMDACGRIDGMVYCVGEARTARLRDLGRGDMERAFAASVFGFLDLVRALMRGKPRGQALRIVAVSSLASGEFRKYLTLYASAKAALEAAVRCLAQELGGRNTRVNAIRPAFVDTPRLKGLEDVAGNLEERLRLSGYQPLGLIDPGDVAGLALWLLGDAATALNGVCIPINGGAAC